MDMVVVRELADREEFVPIILPLVHKESEVLLHFLVHAFGLTISLGVVGGRGR
jgi:putative Ca2+/H+ antiporter (TMEM165/GDT1 family)